MTGDGGDKTPSPIVLLGVIFRLPQLTSEAATAKPARPRKRGIRPTTVAVVPVRLAELITVCVTGIAAATKRITAKITFIIGLLAPFF